MVSTSKVWGGHPVRRVGASWAQNADMASGEGFVRWWRVVFPLALLVTLFAWAATSPVGSAPDDDYHLSSIWCAGGEKADACAEDPANAEVRLVPESVGYAHECFASQESTTAACTEVLSDALVPTDRVNNVQGLYPTVFYRAMSAFVGPDAERSVLIMRMVNTFIFIGLLALALVVMTPAVRSAVTITVLVLFIPLGLFVIPSTNPSSWTFTGITFLWVFGLALARRRSWRSRRTWLLAAATILSAVLAIGSRVDAAAYVVVVVVVIGLLTGWPAIKAAPISGALLVTLALIGIVQYLTFGTPGSGEKGGMGGTQPGLGLLLTNIVYLPVYFSGAVGAMALGWNDTFLPPLVFVFGLLGLGALVYRGVAAVPRRKAAALVVATGALIVIPLVFLQREGLGVGEVVQARYLLPLMLLLFLTLSLAVPFAGRNDGGIALPRAMVWLLAIGMTASGGLSLWVNAHRYSSGSERGLFDIDLVLEWTGITGLPLPLVIGIGVLATALYVVAAAVGVHRDGQDPGAKGRRGSRTAASRLVR